MYSTWRSVDSAGYWDFSFLTGNACPTGKGVCWVDREEEGVRMLLLMDGWRKERGMAVGDRTPLRTERVDDVRVDGNDDKDGCR